MKSTKIPEVHRKKESKNKPKARNRADFNKKPLTPIQELAGCFKKYTSAQTINIEKAIDAAVEKVAHERALKYQRKH